MVNDENLESANTEEEDLPVIPSDWAEFKIPKPTITLNDGTILNGAIVSSETSDIWVFPDNLGFMEAVAMFSDTTKTTHLVCTRGNGRTQIFDGYTKLLMVGTNADDKVQIQMGKAV